MKKLAVLLLLVIFLCACQRIEIAQPVSESDPSLAQSPAPIPDTGAPGTVAVEALRYLGDQYDMAVTHTGLYEKLSQDNGHALLIYADFAKREQSAACRQEGCLHKDEQCAAFIGGIADPLAFAGGGLLYATGAFDGSGGAGAIEIWQISPEEQTKSLLCALPQGISNVTFLCTDDKTLFLNASTQVVYENPDVPGVMETSPPSNALLGIDMASGDIVLQADCGDRNFFNVLGDRILYTKVMPPDGSLHPFILGAWSPKTGEDEILVDKPASIDNQYQFANYHADGHYYGWIGDFVYGELPKEERLARTDVRTGAVTEIPVNPAFPKKTYFAPAGSFWMMDGWLVGYLSDNVNPQRQVWINPETGEWREPPLTATILGMQQQINVVAGYGEFYVVVPALKEYGYTYHDTQTGEDIPQTGHCASYALIDKDDFWGGDANYLYFE